MNKSTYVVVVIIFRLLAAMSFTAGEQVETNQEILPDKLQGEELFSYLNHLAVENRKAAPASSLIYATRALEVAIELQNVKFQTETHNSLGVVHFYMNASGDTLNHFYKAIVLLEQVNDSSLMANTLNNIGNVYFLSGLKELVIQYYTNSHQIKEMTGNDKNTALAEYATANEKDRFFVSKYKLQLPSEHELKTFIENELLKDIEG